MGRKATREITWHCQCGHDFEMETELRPERCPYCGGTDIERVEVRSRLSRLFGDTENNNRKRWWR